jgi:hypothetical protein
MSAAAAEDGPRPGAAQRLWHRAPIWRALVGVAAVGAIMTALYPPDMHPVKAAVESSYVPLKPNNIFGPSYHSFVTIGTRKFPLPSGTWHLIQQFRIPTPPSLGLTYARVSDDRLTGTFIAWASTAPSAMPQRFTASETCSRADAYKTRQITGDDPNTEECWGVAALDTAATLPSNAAGRLNHLLIRLREGNTQLPPVMIAADWFQATDREFAFAAYAFAPPDTLANATASDWKPDAVAGDPAKAAMVAGVVAWTNEWAALLEQGMKGNLTPADVTAALGRHPE